MASRPDFMNPDRKSLQKVIRAVQASEIGLGDSRPGHVLGRSGEPSAYGSIEFVCSCGQRFHMRVVISGVANKESSREWAEHLVLADADPEEVVEVGMIHITRESQRVFVVAATWPHLREFAKNGNIGWNCTWAALLEGVAAGVYKTSNYVSTKKVLGGGHTRQEAITEALRQIGTAEKRGSRVERFEGVGDLKLPDSISVKKVLAALLERSDTEDLEEMSTVIDSLREVVWLLPVMTARLEQLVDRRERKLLAPLELAREEY